MGMRPSPAPRSSTTSSLVVSAICSMRRISRSGVGTQTESLLAWPSSGGGAASSASGVVARSNVATATRRQVVMPELWGRARASVQAPGRSPGHRVRAAAVVRVARESIALQAPDILARDAIAVERVEADLRAAHAGIHQRHLAPAAFGGSRKLLVVARDLEAEYVAGDGNVPAPVHGGGHDPHVAPASLHFDLLVGVPVAQVELVRHDAGPRRELQEPRLEPLHGARAHVEKNH